jgi:shikimate kinase
MASGKSKIGRRVARSLSLALIDTDQRIVEQHGAITEIFAQHGEARFRQLEREAVTAALLESQKNGAVISLGGGAILDPATQADLAHCTVIFLTTTAAAVESRDSGKKRPLLANGTGEWQRIYDARRPIYEALASIRFDTSARPIDSIAADIVSWLKETS